MAFRTHAVTAIAAPPGGSLSAHWLMPTARLIAAATLLLLGSAPANAQAVTLLCRSLTPDPTNTASMVQQVVVDLKEQRLELASTQFDLTGKPSRWIFQNRAEFGDRVAFVRNGDMVSIAAFRMIAHAFVLDLKSGGFSWTYVDNKGTTAFRFACGKL